MQVRPSTVRVTRRPAEVRTPGEPWTDVRRLIVVRHDRLGDVVLTLPAVAALRRAYPAARLALLVRPALEPLARMVEAVDDVLVAHADRGTLRRTVAGYRADAIVCISRGLAIPWAASRAGVPHRVGAGYRYYTPLFTRTVAERRRAGDRHEVEYALAFAYRAGARPGPARFPLRVPRSARESVARWRSTHRREGPYVLLHPGTGGSCPAWPVPRWLDLAGRLRAAGVDVVVNVGPSDAAVLAALETADDPVRELPRFTAGIEGLAALVGAAALVVGNSTGPVHLAAALGAPTLALHAPWPTCGPIRWGPYADNGLALVAGCAEALDWSRRQRRARGAALMGALALDTVTEVVEALLERRPP